MSGFLPISSLVLRKIKGQLKFTVYSADSKPQVIFPKGRMVALEQIPPGTSLAVHHYDYRSYLASLEKILPDALGDPSAAPPDYMEIVCEMTDLIMFEMIVNLDMDERMFGGAAEQIKTVLRAWPQDHLAEAIKTMNRYPYTLRHSIGTALIGVFFCMRRGLGDKAWLEVVTQAAFFHDVGMALLSFDAEAKADLSEDEWKELHTHPNLTVDWMEKGQPLLPAVREAILQHHEQVDGGGYPSKIAGPSETSQIVAMADAFSALVTRRPFRKEVFFPAKALAIMAQNAERYDQGLFSRFSAFFSPHAQ